MGILSFEMTTSYDFSITASDLKVETQDELNAALKSFNLDSVEFEKMLQRAGYSLEQWYLVSGGVIT